METITKEYTVRITKDLEDGVTEEEWEEELYQAMMNGLVYDREYEGKETFSFEFL